MVIEILSKINPWWSGKNRKTGIQREAYLKKIRKYISTKEITILTGVRRAGKTTLLLQIISNLIEKGIDPKQILFVNFDEADIAALENPIKQVLDAYKQNVCNGEKTAYLFFDEIQNIKGWERWAKSIYDEGQHRLIISGSQLLDNRLATLISGRYLRVSIFPLDFSEFLQFKNIQFSNKLDMASKKDNIIRILREFLHYGGFPRICLENDKTLKKEILKNYYESIIYRDILLMHKIRQTRLMKELIYYLTSNFTGAYSYSKLSKNLSADFLTIKEYFSYIEQSKAFFEVPFFSYSLKTQNRNNKKSYCIDNGLRNAISFKFSKDEGRLAENLAFIELKRRGKEVYYWQGKGEVDFVVKNKDNCLEAINISYTNDIREREISALLEFKKQFKKTKSLTILTKDLEKKEKNINFVPLWKWLL